MAWLAGVRAQALCTHGVCAHPGLTTAGLHWAGKSSTPPRSACQQKMERRGLSSKLFVCSLALITL